MHVKGNKNAKAKKKVCAQCWVIKRKFYRQIWYLEEMRNVEIKFVAYKQSEASRVQIERDTRAVCNPQSCKTWARIGGNVQERRDLYYQTQSNIENAEIVRVHITR